MNRRLRGFSDAHLRWYANPLLLKPHDGASLCVFQPGIEFSPIERAGNWVEEIPTKSVAEHLMMWTVYDTLPRVNTSSEVACYIWKWRVQHMRRHETHTLVNSCVDKTLLRKYLQVKYQDTKILKWKMKLNQFTMVILKLITNMSLKVILLHVTCFTMALTIQRQRYGIEFRYFKPEIEISTIAKWKFTTIRDIGPISTSEVLQVIYEASVGCL